MMTTKPLKMDRHRRVSMAILKAIIFLKVVWFILSLPISKKPTGKLKHINFSVTKNTDVPNRSLKITYIDDQDFKNSTGYKNLIALRAISDEYIKQFSRNISELNYSLYKLEKRLKEIEKLKSQYMNFSLVHLMVHACWRYLELPNREEPKIINYHFHPYIKHKGGNDEEVNNELHTLLR